MDAGTIADIVVALAAVAALGLSIYNTATQRTDAAKQEERWQQEEERRERERQPSLAVHKDTRYVDVAESIFESDMVVSYRVVNDGQVPVEIRSLRMVMGNGQHIPIPSVSKAIGARLFENEKPAKGFTPFVLPTGQSVRFATTTTAIENTLKQANLRGFVRFQVAVVDSLGNNHVVDDYASPDEDDPEP